MFNLFFNFLTYLGFYYKNAKITLIGPDNAGKTSLLQLMRDNLVSIQKPTMHPNCEELIFGNIKFQTYDLGGHEAARKLWKQYMFGIDAIVFLVDAQDSYRFSEAKKELQLLLEDDSLNKIPILVFGNKIDCSNAVSEARFRHIMGLQNTSGKTNFNIEEIRPIEVFMCSVIKKFGYKEGFEWLSKFI